MTIDGMVNEWCTKVAWEDPGKTVLEEWQSSEGMCMVLSVAGRTKSNWPGLRTSEHGCAVSCELGWCFVDVLLTVFTDTRKQNFSRTISFHFSSPSKYGIWISI